MKGQLDVLNCGEGHLEIKFHHNDAIECERAKRIIQDMLKRGYALFVHGTDDALIRVKRFVADKGLYIIADGPTIPPETLPPSKNKPKERQIPAARAKATVVGRSAGG